MKTLDVSVPVRNILDRFKFWVMNLKDPPKKKKAILFFFWRGVNFKEICRNSENSYCSNVFMFSATDSVNFR